MLSITSSIEVLKREVVDKRNIAFEDIGFVFYENEEGAAVSPEFVLFTNNGKCEEKS